MPGFRSNSRASLRRERGIPVLPVRYHKDGKFFMPLERFPGALCDPVDFVMFESREAYEATGNLHLTRTRAGDRINVIEGGISRLPGYRVVATEPDRHRAGPAPDESRPDGGFTSLLPPSAINSLIR